MRGDSALLTDLYQITMAQGYWEREQMCGAVEEACFIMHFRDYPFKGGYAIACGMAQLAELVEDYRFTEEDIAYLATLQAPGGGALFEPRPPPTCWLVSCSACQCRAPTLILG